MSNTNIQQNLTIKLGQLNFLIFYSIILQYYLAIIEFHFQVREAFKKNNDETYGKFHILGGGQQGVIFYMLSQKILNAQKAILSIFRHFYFFPLCTSPPSTTILWAK